MVCADCGATAVADTRLDGHDDVEVLGWLVGGFPGALYCAWRHLLRMKLCGRCGGDALLRETRAATARQSFLPATTRPRVHSERRWVRWPRHLVDPAARLRRSGGWLAGWSLVAAGVWSLGAAVLLLVLAGEVRQRFLDGPREDCAAWDASGRALPIEIG